jgi:hypothetical protein
MSGTVLPGPREELSAKIMEGYSEKVLHIGTSSLLIQLFAKGSTLYKILYIQ